MDNTEFFSTGAVAGILGIPRRKIFSFVERGYIIPTHRIPAGERERWEWSFKDVVRLAIFKLLQGKRTVEDLVTLGGFMADEGHLSPDEEWILPIGGFTSRNVYIMPYSTREMGDVRLSSYPLVLHVNLSAVHAWIRERLPGRAEQAGRVRRAEWPCRGEQNQTGPAWQV